MSALMSEHCSGRCSLRSAAGAGWTFDSNSSTQATNEWPHDDIPYLSTHRHVAHCHMPICHIYLYTGVQMTGTCLHAYISIHRHAADSTCLYACLFTGMLLMATCLHAYPYTGTLLMVHICVYVYTLALLLMAHVCVYVYTHACC